MAGWIAAGIGGAVFLFFVLPFGLVAIANHKAFGARFDSYRKGYVYLPEEYPDCRVKEEWDIPGNSGQKIHIRVYSDVHTLAPKALILWSSGIGGDHSPYLPMLAYLASKGYRIVAYDPTGTGRSEGKRVGGLPQNMLDERAVLAELKRRDFLGGLPFYLMGHSNGAYSTLALLKWDTGASAAVVFAPFNDTNDMVMFHVRSFAHGLGRLAQPYVRAYYRRLFGGAVEETAAAGLAHAGIPVCMIHSRDDDVVPFSEFEAFEKLPHHPKSVFWALENRQHEAMFPPAVREQMRPLKKRIDKTRDLKEKAELSIRYYEISKTIDKELLDRIDSFLESVGEKL